MQGEGSDRFSGGDRQSEPALSTSAMLPELSSASNWSKPKPDPDPVLSSSPEVAPDPGPDSEPEPDDTDASGLPLPRKRDDADGFRAERVMLLRSGLSSELDCAKSADRDGDGVSRGGPAGVAFAHARMLERCSSESLEAECESAEDCFGGGVRGRAADGLRPWTG